MKNIAKAFAAVVAAQLVSAATAASTPTVDQLYTSTWNHTRIEYTPSAGGDPSFNLSFSLDTFQLSDGSVWKFGSGSVSHLYADAPLSIEVNAGEIAYRFAQPADGEMFRYSTMFIGPAFDGSNGSIGTPSDLVLTAKLGSKTATMSGYVKILSNDAGSLGPYFRPYSAPVGASIYFEETFTLTDTVFDQTLFQRDFWYTGSGVFDFTNVASAVPEPRTYGMLLLGLAVLGFASRWRGRMPT